MHQQDFPAGDSTGTGGRKMSHPSGFHHRRGSGGTSAPPPSSSSSSSSPASVVLGGEDGGQTGSSAPGLHPQLQVQAAGAQMKKKSGFQITSVTSAQVNISASNSLADDTESYDDLDESHTEDLSSSDLLDAPAARPADAGPPERSSSDETLNSLHGGDTPGLASPNEPLPPQGTQASMVNGSLHHQQPHQQQHHQQQPHQQQPPAPLPPPQAQQAGGAEGVAPSASTHSSQTRVHTYGTGKPPRTAALSPPAATAGTAGLHPASVGASCAETRNPTPVGTGRPAAGAAPSGTAGHDGSTAVVPAQSTAPNSLTQTQQAQQAQQAQAPTGSRFRVVKLDTTSEPFRRGRWTCTEYYEKDIPPAPLQEAPRASEAQPANPEAGVHGAGGTGPTGPPPAQTLQPPLQGVQDSSSTSAVQSPPLPLPPPRLQDLSRGPSLLPTPGGLAPPAGPAEVRSPAPMGQQAPALPAGLVCRPPDFIRPTAPFQTQVQPLPPGVAMVTGQGGGPSAPVGHAQQPLRPGTPAAAFAPQGPPTRLPAHGHVPSVPLTALHADLQPLLAPGAAFPPGGASLRTSHLEDAQRLLLQAQLEQRAHMGMAADASALMAAAAAAAAGLRGPQAEGDDDSSSGASVVAIDNKIEQAMDLVKSHLMYAVREEVEVLKEQIKELLEKNSQLEQENSLLKTLASPEQMAQFQALAPPPAPPPASLAPPSSQTSGPSA